MNRFEKYKLKHRHPCADCGAPVSKFSKRCKPCDRLRRKKEMSENPIRLRHGFAKSEKSRPEYYIWSSMHQRCSNPKAQQYDDYGGRGIKVCERWNLFDNFIADMGSRPEGKHPSGRAMYTLERERSNEGYGPDNCVWATYRQQSFNRRNNRTVTYLGEERLLADLIEKSGLDYKIVHQRIARGWSIERALGEEHKGVRRRGKA